MSVLRKKTPPEQNNSGKKIEAESAVPILVYLCIVLMVHKYRQSAKRIRSNKNILFEVFPLTAGIAGSGKTVPFEKRRSRYKEIAENKAEAYRVYVEHLFSACDAVDARIFSKGEETGVNYYGARYLDPKYSRWLSGDPALSDYIPKAPIDDEAKKHNEKLPGMGGVFNVVNLHLYHYAGNNPVKYTDPDGRSEELGSDASDHCLVRRTDDGKHVIVDGGTQYNYVEQALINYINTEEEKYLNQVPETSDPLAVAGISAFIADYLDNNDTSNSIGSASDSVLTCALAIIGSIGESRNKADSAIVNGREYSAHAIQRMKERNLGPMVIEETIKNGTKTQGNTPNTFVYFTDEAKVFVNETGKVVTAIPQ